MGRKPGPAPKPTALLKLAGTYRADRHGTAEPAPPAAIPSCPKHLDRRAKVEWRRMCKQLELLGLITLLDRAALAAYCVSYSRWVEAEIRMQEHGPVVKSPNGYPIQNPWLSISDKALDNMRKLLTEFGLTPSSRSRLSRESNTKPAGVRGRKPRASKADQLERQMFGA